VRWLRDRVKGAFNSWVERGILAALALVVLFAWRKRHAEVSIDVTVPVWAIVAVVVAYVLVLVVALLRPGSRSQIRELEEEIDLSAFYSRHVYDTLETLQKVLTGTIPDVTIGSFIDQGILQPARDFLTQRSDEIVRLSVLVPDDGNWEMAFAAGYRLEAKQRFTLPIVGSFSRHAFESGKVQWSFDLKNDSRFTPHPKATREYESIISVPIKIGDEVVAVFNVDSSLKDAFPFADFVYINMLGAIISVVWALGGYQPGEENGASEAGEGPETGLEDGKNDDDRRVH
jgi:hypothetical protein